MSNHHRTKTLGIALAGVAVVTATAAGGAAAATLVTSDRIAPHTIRAVDFKAGAVKSHQVKDGTITRPDITPSTASKLSVRGPVGRQGPAGPQGERGPAGPRGQAGDQGLRGKEGPIGEQGQRGAAGLAGVDGATGPMGPQGSQGLAGRPGVSDLSVVTSSQDVQPGVNNMFSTPVCPVNRIAIAGGANGGAGNLLSAYPDPSSVGGRAWTVVVQGTGATKSTWKLYTVCVLSR